MVMTPTEHEAYAWMQFILSKYIGMASVAGCSLAVQVGYKQQESLPPGDDLGSSQRKVIV